MLNQLVLVGKIKDIEKRDNETIILLKVARNFKNERGEYENDLIKCDLPQDIADNVNKYCSIDDLVGVRGRVTNDNAIIVEKFTYLTSKKN